MKLYSKIKDNKSGEDGLLMRFLQWREAHISEAQCVVILAVLTGVASGLAAVLLKTLIGSISSMLMSHLSISQDNYIYLITPILGIFIVGMYVRYVVKDNISHGVTQVLYAISQKKSRLKFQALPSARWKKCALFSLLEVKNIRAASNSVPG